MGKIMILLIYFFGFIKTTIEGLIENTFYGVLSLIFILFFKKWFFKFINSEIDKIRFNDKTRDISTFYFIVRDSYRYFGDCEVKDGKLEIVNFSNDLILRVTSENDDNKYRSITIRSYRIPIKTYFNIFKTIFSFKLIKFFNKKHNPTYEVSVHNGFEKIIKEEYSLNKY